jgi:hypothetical protein
VANKQPQKRRVVGGPAFLPDWKTGGFVPIPNTIIDGRVTVAPPKKKRKRTKAT